jgi:hypothetical protein
MQKDQGRASLSAFRAACALNAPRRPADVNDRARHEAIWDCFCKRTSALRSPMGRQQ